MRDARSICESVLMCPIPSIICEASCFDQTIFWIVLFGFCRVPYLHLLHLYVVAKDMIVLFPCPTKHNETTIPPFKNCEAPGLHPYPDVGAWSSNLYCIFIGGFVITVVPFHAGTQVNIWENGGKKHKNQWNIGFAFFPQRGSHPKNSHGDLVDQLTPKCSKATRSKK